MSTTQNRGGGQPPKHRRIPPEKRLTVIFKVCNRCNAACTFCSIGPSGKKKIAWPDFELLVERLATLAQRWDLKLIKLTFHGGEPTMMGAAWYEKACALVSRLPVQVQFNMQSNLIAFPPAMIEVAHRYDIRVGSSIDPLFGERRTRKGKDAFPAWLESYKRLTEAGLRIHAIFVITAEALKRTHDLYQIAESLGSVSARRFVLQLNPVYPQGKAALEDALLLDPRELGRYYGEMLEIALAHGLSVHLVPLESFYDLFAGRGHPSFPCTFGGNCARSHVGVDFDLRVAGCGRRLDSEQYLGSLRERELADILENDPETQRILKRAAHLEKGACRDCEFFSICHGGCPDDAELAGGDFMSRHSWCESFKLFFRRTRELAKDPTVRAPQPIRRPLENTDLPVVLATDPRFLNQNPAKKKKCERWLLPTRASKALGFDSALDKLVTPDTHMLRLWVQNRRVPTLALWEKLLRRPDVRVVLFEAEGLKEATFALNRLGATIIYHLPLIAQTAGWQDAVDAVLDRFLHDVNWQSQIYPFTWMLANSVHHHAVPITNCWGLYPTPRSFVAPADLADTVHPPQLWQHLQLFEREARAGGGPWLRRHRACLECPLFRICGGHLAAEQGPCRPALRARVEKLHRIGQSLRREMNAEAGGVSPTEGDHAGA